MILETVGKTTTTSSYRSAEMSDRRVGVSHADRVRCQGQGLKRADIETVNYFTVDASDAGTRNRVCGAYVSFFPDSI